MANYRFTVDKYKISLVSENMRWTSTLTGPCMVTWGCTFRFQFEHTFVDAGQFDAILGLHIKIIQCWANIKRAIDKVKLVLSCVQTTNSYLLRKYLKKIAFICFKLTDVLGMYHSRYCRTSVLQDLKWYMLNGSVNLKQINASFHILPDYLRPRCLHAWNN